jgi:hypothetical protein
LLYGAFIPAQTRFAGAEMADRSALSRIGLMLGAATMMVMMLGTVVVTDHLSGRLQIDDSSTSSLSAKAR